ncbi:MAG TPA: META domain-containing protein, partial [Mycobacteriales bacterium]|nr:META domain-containing protein [Mycobacteriales bacterium]
VILVAITTGFVATRPGPPAGPSGATGAEPPLLGTAWQLASYQLPGAAPVPVRADSTLAFSPKGTVSIHACNYIGGPAHVVGSRVGFGSAASTDMLCTGERGTLDQHILALLAGGAADWSIRDRTLTLTGRDGLVLTYRVRASIYPDLTARTLIAGDHAGGQYRLAITGPGGPLGLTIETRTAPGDDWGQAGVIAPGPKDCLANHVTAGGRLGGQAFLAAWATPEVARVTVRAKPGAPETTLPFLAVPGSTLRVAGLWTAVFRPSVSPVTFYDRAGAVIAAYPDGPC